MAFPKSAAMKGAMLGAAVKNQAKITKKFAAAKTKGARGGKGKGAGGGD